MTGSGGVRKRRVAPTTPTRYRVRRLGMVVVLGAVAWGVWFSPLLALRAEGVEVAVLDASGGAAADPGYVDIAAVMDAIAPFVGTPLPRLDVGAVEVAAESVPGVRNAVVSRSWPRGLSVDVEPRRPVAAVPDAAGGYTIVDMDGVTLARQDQPPEGLPVLTVPLGEGEARVLAAALAVANSLPDALAIRVEAIRADTEDSVTLVLRDGIRVEWGSAEDSRLKAAVVIVLLTSEAGMAAEIIDVSAPTLPVTR